MADATRRARSPFPPGHDPTGGIASMGAGLSPCGARTASLKSGLGPQPIVGYRWAEVGWVVSAALGAAWLYTGFLLYLVFCGLTTVAVAVDQSGSRRQIAVAEPDLADFG